MRTVRISLSVACVCFVVAWASVLPLNLRLVPLLPYRDYAAVIFGVGHLIAVLAILFAAVEGLSAFIKHREHFSFSDYSLTVGAIILCAIVAYWFATPHYVY